MSNDESLVLASNVVSQDAHAEVLVTRYACPYRGTVLVEYEITPGFYNEDVYFVDDRCCECCEALSPSRDGVWLRQKKECWRV